MTTNERLRLVEARLAETERLANRILKYYMLRDHHAVPAPRVFDTSESEAVQALVAALRTIRDAACGCTYEAGLGLVECVCCDHDRNVAARALETYERG